MSETLGSLCIVLHGHLPYVLHHGTYPHGEAWLYEAAAETYLPLLDMIGECALHKARPGLTAGLTPVLLEQLSHDRFKEGFVAYLAERVDRATSDKREFEQQSRAHEASLAQNWVDWYAGKREQFERLGRDLPAQFGAHFRAGHIQCLTSNATHAYMPLLLNDQMLRAQMAAGTATSERILGLKPRGMWLPECAYRPQAEHWMPAVLYDNPRFRPGVEQFIADAGVTHFFVDNHLITGGQPLGVYENGAFRPVSEPALHWDQRRGWRHPLEPVGVASKPEAPRTFAFARHPRASEQVWSGSIGYPGAGEYLEFHRKHGDRGLRYHKVTNTRAPISDKHPYYPDDVPAKVYEHAQHFCGVVRQVLGEYKFYSGRSGVCVAPFDAELFGHWWFEGPQFLRDVVLQLNADPDVELSTADDFLRNHPPDKVVSLPEGSWGEKGDHRVWANEKVNWMWDIEYRCEANFGRATIQLPWRQNKHIEDLLKMAGRELLLLQASDWPFVITRGQAVDYGIKRFMQHVSRFENLIDLAEKASQDTAYLNRLNEMEEFEIRDAKLHDIIFNHIELTWWNM